MPDTCVGVLVRCQDAARDGYVGGVPGGRDLGNQLSRGEVDADLFTLNGRWVPLYNLHKTLAGLLDAHQFAGLTDALGAATALADWWLGVSAGLDQPAFERILRTEFGGMNDAFAVLWDLTGDDRLPGGSAPVRAPQHPGSPGVRPGPAGRAARQHPDPQNRGLCAARRRHRGSRRTPGPWTPSGSQWCARRSVSVGGNSVREHFHPAADFAPMVQEPQGPETCNTYNMLKLAQLRFETCGDPAAIDFYERATYNHILSSQHPGSGGLVYFTPMRPGHYRVYSKAQESMWCCVGSGLENHARYGELIYSHTDTDLLVNLYIPSTLDWTERGLTVRLETDFPSSGLVTLTITAAAPVDATIRLRRPGWATDMTVDGGGPGITPATTPLEAGDIRLSGRWAGTSTVRIRLTAGFEAEALPDGSPWVSFRYGPMVLAARGGSDGVPGFEAADERMGHVAAGSLQPMAATPVVADTQAISRRATPDVTAVLTVVDPAGRPATVNLEPFHRMHDCRYTVYWPAGEPAVRRAELRAWTGPPPERPWWWMPWQPENSSPRRTTGSPGMTPGPGGKAASTGGTPAAGSPTCSPIRTAGPRSCGSASCRGDAHQHILRLNGAVLTNPVRGIDDGGLRVSDFDITAGARRGKGLVFTVEAVRDSARAASSPSSWSVGRSRVRSWTSFWFPGSGWTLPRGTR